MNECELCGVIPTNGTLTGDSHPRGPNFYVCQSCAQETLEVTENGLKVPNYLRTFDKQVVFRTPRSTIQHFGTTTLDDRYDMIRPEDFGDVDDPHNPELLDRKVSIMPQGEDADVFWVTIRGDGDD